MTGRKPSERVPQTHLDGARTTLFGALRRSDAAEVGGFERGRRIPGAWIHRHNRLLYGHPTTLLSPANVAIKATSVAEPTASATTTLTVSALPNITSLSPNPITTATYTLTVTGVGFRNGAVIKVLGANVPTTWLSSTQVRGTGTFSASNSSVPVVVTNPGRYRFECGLCKCPTASCTSSAVRSHNCDLSNHVHDQGPRHETVHSDR